MEEATPSLECQLKKEEEVEKAQKAASVLFNHMLLNVCINTVVVGTRPILMIKLLNGDADKANEYLSLCAGLIGATEFLVNPVLGRLSDQIGRKPMMLIGPVTNLIFKSLVALRPSVTTLLLERVVCTSMTTVSGSTTCSAVLSDISSSTSLAIKGASLGTAAGAGCIIGPLTGGLLAKDPLVPFAAAALVSSIDIAYVLNTFEETLDKSTPFDYASISPLRFTKLFTEGSRTQTMLLVIAGLLCFPEGKNLSDFNQFYILEKVKMSNKWRTAFTVGFGAAMFWSGYFAKQTLKLGQRVHTTISNIMTMFGLAVWAEKSSKFNMFVGLFLLSGGMERRAAVNSILTNIALNNGFLRGEYAGLFANWRAIITSVAPLLYAYVYKMSPTSAPGRPYLVAGFICLLAEALLRTMSDKALGLS